MDDLLRECHKWLLLECDNNECKCGAADLRNRIQQRLDTGGWIPVAERLPEMGEQVMVAVKDFGIGTDCYGDSPTWENFGDDVTHWQPLPALQKEK